MILYVKGNLFESPAQTLVNTVNTVGVMGKGVALEFKKLFPAMYQEYRDLCEQNRFQMGQLWLYKDSRKWVLNFPTKEHWRAPSKMEYIEKGLYKFTQIYSELGIHSIAFPPLGCGNGQLDFGSQVQPLMERYLKSLPIDIFIYPERKSEFIEHLNTKEMKNWLNAEPANLSFLEVWDDLSRLLKEKREFDTLNPKESFQVEMTQEPKAIQIFALEGEYLVHYETLLSFWQQLRTHGFSMQRIAPGLGKELTYLIPVFSALPYVSPVHLAEGYQKLNKSAITGLQILPNVFSHKASKQLSLFPVA